MSKKKTYWERRATRYEKEWDKRCEETIEKRLARQYQGALSTIKDDILKLYAIFAKDNGMDFDEARRFLSSKEFREWRMTMQEYLRLIADGDKGLELELNTLAMRPRITRLEKLYAETLQELDKLGRDVNKQTKDFLSDAYKSSYTRDIFDMVKVGGLSVAVAKLDNIGVAKVLAARWSGKNYSQRIWTNTRLLSHTIKKVVADGVHRGLSIDQLSKMVEDKMHAGYKNAVRLVRTEMNFVNNQAHANSMKDAGIDSYEFIAVLDNKTSARCRARDGEVYALEEKSVGFNYPPLHPRCRSTVAPYIEGISKKGTRAAKDKSGKNIDIPAAMKYFDYESVYIKKEKSLEAWKKEIREKSTDFNSRGLAAGNSRIYTSVEGTPPKLIGRLPNTTPAMLNQSLQFFEERIVTAPIENAVIITKAGDIYHCTGDLETVTPIKQLGDKLKGSVVTHNHPIGSANEYSFSIDDFELYIDYEIAVLRGVDEKFIYELTRNPLEIDSIMVNTDDFESGLGYGHWFAVRKATELKIGYRRWRRE